METFRLGRTNMTVTRTGFGALPIQRVDFDAARKILRRAHEAGITFFDTANGYSDSEEKIGYSLADVRKSIVLATKSGAADRGTVLEHIELSLKRMKTDYIDLLQLHNPRTLPDPDNPDSSYAGAIEAREKGMIRHLGVTCHALENALAAASSGLYDTVQFPLSMISSDEDLALIDICRQNDIGLIAMKALCGGLLTAARPAFAFLRQFDNVVPIWGIQRIEELEELLMFDENPPLLDDEMLAFIDEERTELAGDFCRACGYCLPCPADIPIPMAARMSLLLRRMPDAGFVTPEWQERMKRIENCTDCGACRERCPYNLSTPDLLKKNYSNYLDYLQEVS